MAPSSKGKRGSSSLIPPEEGAEEISLLPCDHPLLEQVQATLNQQLSTLHKSLSLEYQEKKEQEKRLAQNHEELGIKLYNAQQELQKQQKVLHRLSEGEEEMKRKRTETETALTKGLQRLEAKQKELDEYVKKLDNARQELNAVKLTLQQTQMYNEKLQADIKLKRRETHKEDATLQKKETEKMKQDFLVDRLKEQLRDLNEQRKLYESQANEQVSEAEAALAALREAQREIEAVNIDKQHLLQQWRSSVRGMERRNDAIQAIKEMVSKQEEKEVEIEAKLRDMQANLKKVQEQNELLTMQENLKEREVTILQKQIENAGEELKCAEKQNQFWQQSLQNTAEEGNKAEIAVSQLNSQIRVVDGDIRKTSQRNNESTEEFLTLLSNQGTLNRAATTTSKRASHLREVCRKKEEEYAQLQNDTARTKVDVLDMKAQNLALKEDLRRLQTMLSEKEKLVDQTQQSNVDTGVSCKADFVQKFLQCEVEIKKGHIAVDKKQQVVERLNKEYDEKRNKMDDEGDGPLEARIKNMRRLLATKSKEGTDLQNLWMKKQTELIAAENKSAALEEEVTAKKDSDLILQQKKIRLTSEIAKYNREFKETQTAMKSMQTEMSRINQLITKHADRAKYIRDQTLTLKQEFTNRKAEHEGMKEQLSRTVESLREETRTLQDELIEAEKQIMLWERKISLQKQMFEELDPAIGQSELSAMKKEIHRMQLRLEQLKKYQQQTLGEIQRSIQKREFIELKHEPRQTSTREVHERMTLERQSSLLKKKLKKATGVTSKLQTDIKESTDQVLEQHDRLCQALNEISASQSKITATQHEALKLKLRRSFNLACILQYQKLIKRLNAATEAEASAPLKASTIAAIKRVRDEAKNLVEALARLEIRFPDLQSVFESFRLWAKVVGDAAVPPSPAFEALSTNVL